LIIAGRGAGIDREQKRAMKKSLPHPSVACRVEGMFWTGAKFLAAWSWNPKARSQQNISLVAITF